MTKRSKDAITGHSADRTPAGSVELDEQDLGQASGGGPTHIPAGQWKMPTFDAKGNDVLTEELQGISGPRTKIDGNEVG